VNRWRSSPRFRRRVTWAAALAAAVGGVVAIALASTNVSEHPLPATGTEPPQVASLPEATVLSKADALALVQASRKFVVAGVARRHLDVAYDMVGPELRSGLTRAEWTHGANPVVPFPAIGIADVGFAYSYPNDVALDLEAENGGLVMHGVSGQFTLRTTNGPIDLKQVSGKVDGRAVNGPISFSGHAGDVRLEAENGPVGVTLDAATWSGRGLTASTQNGPMSIAAPNDLRTGIEVQGSEHSPFSWNSVGDKTSASWDGNRTVRMGTGPVQVRLSTVNGPVNIEGPSSRRATPRTVIQSNSSSKSVKI